jgi:pyridoxine kinase
VRTPKLPISVNGAGDAIAALFFAHYLRSGSAAEAVSRAASSVFGVLQRTAGANAREILLVDAQDEFVKPGRVFAAEKL